MPITRKYHLKDLMDACRAYPLRPWEKLTFEYVLLGGVNDTDADARRVVEAAGEPQLQSESDRAESRSRRSPTRPRIRSAWLSFQQIVAAFGPLLYPQAARTRYLCRLRAAQADPFINPCGPGERYWGLSPEWQFRRAYAQPIRSPSPRGSTIFTRCTCRCGSTGLPRCGSNWTPGAAAPCFLWTRQEPPQSGSAPPLLGAVPAPATASYRLTDAPPSPPRFPV